MAVQDAFLVALSCMALVFLVLAGLYLAIRIGLVFARLIDERARGAKGGNGHV